MISRSEISPNYPRNREGGKANYLTLVPEDRGKKGGGGGGITRGLVWRRRRRISWMNKLDLDFLLPLPSMKSVPPPPTATQKNRKRYNIHFPAQSSLRKLSHYKMFKFEKPGLGRETTACMFFLFSVQIKNKILPRGRDGSKREGYKKRSEASTSLVFPLMKSGF